MWRSTPIKHSEFSFIIDRFDILADIANTMKSCHVYRVSVEDGCLYGCNETAYTLHKIMIPPQYLPPYSFSFRYDTLDMEKVKRYRRFVAFAMEPWVLIPYDNLAYIDDYIQYYLNGEWVVVDRTTGAQVDFIDLYNPDGDKAIYLPNVLKLIQGKKWISQVLGSPILFTGMEQLPGILEVTTNKASIGSKIIQLVAPNGKTYQITVFRNLFNLNKADKLDIIIRDRLDNPNLYEACFVVKRKNNPIGYILENGYVDEIYTQFINLPSYG